MFKVPDRDLWIACADRWVPDWDGDAVAVHERFDALFDPEASRERKAAAMALDLPRDDAADTSRATYVWLPIRWEGRMPIIDWQDEWRPGG